MDPVSEHVSVSRRRGAELEAAILEAAWEQLLAAGYGALTFEAVAERAHTSKPVLYRRWSTREELFLAVLRHRGATDVVPVPDTGSLRGDVIAMLSSAGERRTGMAALLSARLSAYYQEGTLTPADLRREFIGDRQLAMVTILERARARGELRPEPISERVAGVPFDLFRNEAMMTLAAVPAEVIREIVDDVFLPLVTPPAAPTVTADRADAPRRI